MVIRRQFFSSLAKAGAEILGNNAFYGSVDDIYYTFVPAKITDAPTLIVVNMNLNHSIYTDNFNIITLDKWPYKGIEFWNRLLSRHDLTDEIFAISWEIPPKPPEFLKKLAWVPKNASITAIKAPKYPVLLLREPTPNANITQLPVLRGFASGSDVFVGHPGGANTKNSPTFTRLVSFLLSL